MSPCPGCGLKSESNDQSLIDLYNASGYCWHLYGYLSAFTLSLRDHDFTHQLVVDAYAAQHSGPNVKPISTAFALVGLYFTFERGYTGKQVQQAHMFLGKKRIAWPHVVPPENQGALTVVNVLQGPELQRMEMIRKWGRSVGEMWKPEHGSVRKLVEIYLVYEIIFSEI